MCNCAAERPVCNVPGKCPARQFSRGMVHTYAVFLVTYFFLHYGVLMGRRLHCSHVLHGQHGNREEFLPAGSSHWHYVRLPCICAGTVRRTAIQ